MTVFCEAITIRIPTFTILIVALIAIVCVIAYVSDNMGKNLGKKRLSILGLRPRQTATLLSMLTSVLIMLVTLGALTLFSSRVRDAILRSDRLRQSLQNLNARNKDLKSQSVKLASEQTDLKKQRDALKSTVVQTKKNADQAESDAQKRIYAANQNATTAERKLTAAKTQLDAAQNARDQAQQAQESAQQAQRAAQRGANAASASARQAAARATQAQNRFAVAQQKLNAAQTRLSAAQGRLSAVQNRLSATNNRLTLVNARLALVNARVAQANRRAAQAKQSAYRAGGSAFKAGQDLLVLQAQSAQLEVDNAKAQAELQEAQAHVQAATEAFKEAVQQTFEVSRTASLIDAGDVSVSRGQVLADLTISANSDAAQARAMLRQLLEDGARAATQIGAKPYVNPATGTTRALHLASLPLPPGSGATELDEDAIITNFANRLSTFEVPVSVRLVAARSYARGETRMEGRLVEVPVRRVYVKGDTIALVSLPPNEKDYQIFSDLLKLADKGAELARGKGVQPLLSAQNPNLFADDTNQRIFEAIRRIQNQTGNVSVRLVAARDVSTVDSIRVRFDIGSFS